MKRIFLFSSFGLSIASLLDVPEVLDDDFCALHATNIMTAIIDIEAIIFLIVLFGFSC